MGTLTTTAKNSALDHLATEILYAAALNASDVEVSDARKAVTFAAASSGSLALNGTLPTFDIGAGNTVAKIGYYTALTSGTQLAIDDVTAEAFTAAGQYAVQGGTITISD